MWWIWVPVEEMPAAESSRRARPKRLRRTRNPSQVSTCGPSLSRNREKGPYPQAARPLLPEPASKIGSGPMWRQGRPAARPFLADDDPGGVAGKAVTWGGFLEAAPQTPWKTFVSRQRGGSSEPPLCRMKRRFKRMTNGTAGKVRKGLDQDYRNHSIIGFRFKDEQYPVKTWKDLELDVP